MPTTIKRPRKIRTFVSYVFFFQNEKKSNYFTCSCNSFVHTLFLCTPSSSGSGSHGFTSNSFIFSLRNKEGLAPFKSMVAKPELATYRDPSYGPTFGYGWDIYISDNANTNQNSYADFGQHGTYTVPSGVKDQYTILAGTRNFSPDDWEVFHRQ